MQKEKLTVLDEPVTPPNPARVDGADPLPPLTLISLLPGERGTIDRLQWADPEMRRRLLEMGLVTGTQIEVIRYAPLGDPLQVRIGRTNVSLRKQEARAVLVRKVS